jgi:hypothetical protein
MKSKTSRKIHEMYAEMGNKPSGLISFLSWLIVNSWTQILNNFKLQFHTSRHVQKRQEINYKYFYILFTFALFTNAQRVWTFPLWKGIIFKGTESQKKYLYSSDDEEEEEEEVVKKKSLKSGFLHHLNWGERIRGQFGGSGGNKKTLNSFLWKLWGHFVNQRQQRNLQRRLLLTSPHLPIMTLLNNLSVTSLALNSRIIVLLIQVLKSIMT